MTRNPSIDYVAAKREYIFSEPPPTLSELAEKYQCSRAALAAKAAGEEGGISWFQEREEFRRRLGKKTLEALADKFAAFEIEAREKQMQTANAVLDNFIEALTEGKIKITSKDAIEWAKVQLDLFDAARNAGRHGDVIDGQAVEMTEYDAQKAYDEAMRLLDAGKTDAAGGEAE